MTYIDHRLYSILGESLRDARDSAGMTLADASAAIGVTIMTIQRYEKAERKATVETIRKLCSAYSVDADELMQHAIDRFRSLSPVSISNSESLSSSERVLLSSFRTLNASGQCKLIEYAEDLSPLAAMNDGGLLCLNVYDVVSAVCALNLT